MLIIKQLSSKIINNFSNKKIINEFKELVSKDYAKICINEIQKEFRQYMNATYIPIYLKKINVLHDKHPIERMKYENEFKKQTIDMFETIAIEYLEQFQLTFKELKMKYKCKKEIQGYFNSIRDKGVL